MRPAELSACSSMSASVTSGSLLKKKTTASRKTKPAMPRYVHWTLERSWPSPSLKKTREARRGAATDPTAWKAWESSRRNSERRGGPHVAMKGLADVSSVLSPDPTMNKLPQKPGNDR